jgi:peptide/nickel transport system substrate-binding protein
MKKLRWQLLIIFLTGLVIGVLLLLEQPGTNPLLPQPAAGGTYTEAMVGQMQRLNPLLAYSNQADRDINRLIYSSLFTTDSRGLPKGDLVDKWGISEDGKIYNLELKPGAKWHDGQPLTPEDVVFTIDLMRNGGDVVPQDIQEFWENVEVKALGERNLQFILPEPFAPFLDYLNFGILPKHLLNGGSIEVIKESPINLQPIGSGPYKFKTLMTENGVIKGITLTANEAFYDTAPFIQQINFKYFPDEASALQAYKEGTVQGVSRLSGENLKDALSEPSLLTYSGRLPMMSMILLNLNNAEVPFFQDETIRKAMLLGLDRQRIINTLLKGQAIIANGPIFPGTWAYYDGIQPIPYSPEMAKSQIIQAGYVLPAEGGTTRKKDDAEFAFTMLYPDNEQHKLLAEAIQANWESLGLRVDLEAVPYDVLINERLADRDYQAALVDLNLSNSPDPDPYPFWDQSQIAGGQNYSQWDNRLVSEFLENARVSRDLEERFRFYRNFQVVFNKELPSIPLFYPVYSFGVDQAVQGVSMGPLFDISDRFATISEWFFASNRNRPDNQPTP